MTAERATPALDLVEQARAAVNAARQRVGEVKSARRRAESAVSVVEAELQALHHAAAADGRDVDAKVEREILDRLDEARRAAEPAAWAGRLSAAEEAVDAAVSNIETTIRANRRAIAGEMAAESVAAGEQLLEAIDAFMRAAGAWGGAAGAWLRPTMGEGTLSMAEMLGVRGDVPASPLGSVDLGDIERALAPFAGGVRRDPRRWLPMPTSLAPEGWKPRGR